MSRSRINRKRVALFVLVVAALVAGVVYFFLRRIDEEEKTLVLRYGELDLAGDYSAVVIRNEMVVQTNAAGVVTYLMREGQSVSRDDRILEIYNDGELSEIRRSDDAVPAESVALDYDRIELELRQIRDDILIRMRKGEYVEAFEAKEEFLLRLEAHDKMQEEHRFLARRKSRLAEKAVGETLLPEQRLNVYAPVSGVLSYQIDGLEDQIKPDRAMTIDVDSVLNGSFPPNVLTRERVVRGDRLFKLVDGSQYYLLLKILREELETFRTAENLRIELKGEAVPASVRDVRVQGEFAVALLRLDEPFRDFYTARRVDCKATILGYKGLIVPNEAIVKQDGVDGLYRLNRDRVVEFVPIKVLKFGSESAIIQHGQFFDSKQGLVVTVEIGQEIVKRPSMHSIGERIE